MNDERRRYFRISDTVGISYHVIEGVDEGSPNKTKEVATDVLDLVSRQDQQIEKLLIEVGESHPKVAELVTVFNQKLERIVSQLVIESRLVGRLAHRVKEANLSACGLAFHNDEKLSEGTRLKMELMLYPEEKSITVNGIVVGCDAEGPEWYLRVDFYGLSENMQELMIQHVVKSQSQQLKKTRGN